MKMLHSISRAWAWVEVGALVIVLFTMMSLAVLQIVLRNGFDTSLFWIDPLNRLLVLWLAVLGAMIATRERQHIAIDFLQHYLSGQWLRIVSIVINASAAFVCGLMAWHSFRFVWDEFQYEATTFSGLPAWPFELIMPIGFSVMALRFFVFLFAKGSA